LDPDCPPGYACINQHCEDPCRVINPCHVTAICKVVNTSPVRTMTCVCPPGTIGDGYSACGESLFPFICQGQNPFFALSTFRSPQNKHACYTHCHLLSILSPFDLGHWAYTLENSLFVSELTFLPTWKTQANCQTANTSG
jgi:hypothetical protein